MKKDKNEKEMKEEVLEDFEMKENACNCGETCECEKENGCNCDGNCECGCQEGEKCTCEDDCKCDEQRDCCCHEHHGHGKHHHEEAGQYLAMAQRLQADFENYRRHVSDQLSRERQEGARSVIEVFLPCLDTFKEAKKNISDEGVLSGINMIENKILEALKTLKVEKIEAVGQKFDPHLHNVIAAYADESKEDDIILDEYQAGWTMDGKVIRYSKVVVNKRQ